MQAAHASLAATPSLPPLCYHPELPPLTLPLALALALTVALTLTLAPTLALPRRRTRRARRGRKTAWRRSASTPITSRARRSRPRQAYLGRPSRRGWAEAEPCASAGGTFGCRRARGTRAAVRASAAHCARTSRWLPRSTPVVPRTRARSDGQTSSQASTRRARASASSPAASAARATGWAPHRSTSARAWRGSRRCSSRPS